MNPRMASGGIVLFAPSVLFAMIWARETSQGTDPLRNEAARCFLKNVNPPREHRDTARMNREPVHLQGIDLGNNGCADLFLVMNRY